ncbi:stalk domain-containing protein [Cohnella herbarum]|uniref:DUF4163 domain-containing protein n=1 Tax=Cohnella herbarum TaxID=2728023 RepID=A0A7Z2ZNK4_9BACL|nr:DUF4163 domain-containing protein [Cohnella herbarum]QJD86541.1 DUF4163 domain-containing protein [Cohnella herbarum]
MKKISEQQGKRGFIALTVAAMLAAAPLAGPVTQHASAASNSNYKIIDQAIAVEGVKTSLSALNTDNTTYIAIRSLNKHVGLTTDWNKAKQTVTVTGRDRELVLNLKDGSAMLNEQQNYGLPAIVQNNTTYVPFRFLLERMGYGVSFDTATKLIGVEAIKENDLKISTAALKEVGDKKSLIIHYPQISGYANADVQKKINDLLKSEAETNAAAARDSLNEALGDGDDSLPDVSFDGTYTITYNEQGKLSLYVDYYIYTGGAHGSTARVPYTFDLTTGELLKLKDVTEGNAKYVSIINDKIKSQIKARGLGLISPFETIEPDRDFFLKHNGVVIYFGQYEYTPYAAGMPEFEITYGELK